jgi:predicted acetyltransferase
MPLQLRWVAEDELDRVAQTRMYCYAAAPREIERFKQGIRDDRRAKPGDFLLAERDGEAVGTTTSLSMMMWVRGTPLPCQGVAYVGTIKTQRRVGNGGERGIASQLMNESLRRARERQQVVSALMPFRASYYEHFGYGVIETRNEWTVPLSILPQGNFDGFRFVQSSEDIKAMTQCRQRAVERGQCDIERSPEAWDRHRQVAGEFYEVIDRGNDGSARSFMFFSDAKLDGRTYARVIDQAWDSLDALKRQLHFLASLKDQYSGAILTLPRDLPLNWLLRETQIPHRPVEHPVPKMVPHTRMQVRILDHKRFLEALMLPADVKGTMTISVHECEGIESKFKIDIAEGRARVAPSNAAADVECPDKAWAAIACGELRASDAARFGLLGASSAESARVLDALSLGPPPFCAEYF